MKVPMELEASGDMTRAVIRKGFALPTGFALLLAGGLIAGALIVAPLSQRYMVAPDMVAPGFADYPVRLDRMTGAVEICLVRKRIERLGPDEYGAYLRYECGPELKRE